MPAVDAERRAVDRPTLLVGEKLRCPRCGNLAHQFSYFAFDRPVEFAHELNVVYKCRAKVMLESGETETCRFIFSPGLSDDELASLTEARNA